MLSIFKSKRNRDKNNLKKEIRQLRSDVEQLKSQISRIENVMRLKEIPHKTPQLKKKWSLFK